jgi:hypothetical protein
MSKYAHGTYEIKNIEKYIGKNKPTYRSSWEMRMFMFLDEHPSVINWASESISIPYRNPLTGKNTVYIPDIFMVYEDKNGKRISELIEIKPASQTYMSESKSKKDKAALVVNYAKWNAAVNWCKSKNVNFRVLTEKELFFNGKKN